MRSARLLMAVFAAATLAATFMYASPASATTCGLLQSCPAGSTTPICSNPLAGTCGPCTANAQCNPPLGVGTLICEQSGACGTTCTANFTNSGLTGECPSADAPICVSGSCVQCQPGGDPAQCPTKEAPYCTSASVCGCNLPSECSAGLTCVSDAGAAGQCLSSCTTSATCAAPTTVCDTELDGGLCVECHGAEGCDGGACDEASHVCVPPDAGATRDGGTTPLGDGGTTVAGADGGDDGDGGLVTGEGGIVEPGGGVAGGGDGGAPDDVMYKYGRVEGGGCSLLAGGADSSRWQMGEVFGLAGLAGLFFLRRSRTRSARSTRRRTEDR